MEWEYRVLLKTCGKNQELDIYAIDERHQTALNAEGSEEWELVSVVPVVSDELISAVTYVFKRPKEASFR